MTTPRKPRKSAKSSANLTVVPEFPPEPAPSEPIPLEQPKRSFFSWVRWVIFGK